MNELGTDVAGGAAMRGRISRTGILAGDNFRDSRVQQHEWPSKPDARLANDKIAVAFSVLPTDCT